MSIHNGSDNYFILAEDDEDERFIFKQLFDELPYSYDLRIAEDGFELMNYLEKPNITLPKFILLDLNMPLINGFECLEIMKKDVRLKQIPVIIYSTSKSTEDIDRSYQLGALYYIVKPNNFPELKSIIQKVLETSWGTHVSVPTT